MGESDIVIDIVDVPVCRICYEPCDTIGLCQCAGTLQYVHPKCLYTWIRISQRTKCELCNAPFGQSSEEDKNYIKCIDDMFLIALHVMLLIFVVTMVVVFVGAVEYL